MISYEMLDHTRLNVISYEIAYFLPPISSDLPCKGGFSVTRTPLNQDAGTPPRCHLLPGDHHDDEHKENLGDDHGGEKEDNHGDADANACCRERSP